MTLGSHAVHRLYQYRKAISTKAYNARGKNVVRCEQCLLCQTLCTCAWRKRLSTEAHFLLIMYDDEVLKPSNSGRLIADLVPNTHAYIWSRVQANREMLALIHDPNYQAYVIFPSEYAVKNQPVVSLLPTEGKFGADDGKTPLFIMLDGSWREAIKMFRKSPYLHQLPLLSFSAEHTAQYMLRKGSHDFQLGTAEVAALALAANGEFANAEALTAWFALFVESSLYGRSQKSHNALVPLSIRREAFERTLKVALGSAND
ncbi:tRNA-uridine aminocarboxypropyltransferase [Shewanella surugensis]|uniref:tRNA-uridine aminocarboxypropyltransferase n=1 Tax=Shewanella surugensis TaxID=212020 RepID=A0ABT0L9C7_9GAMM|nr:DTW domain-containing protein [Shewanella surugensis]MCL1124273.1 DTW domain-containing protein [Shewanella surugensis]